MKLSSKVKKLSGVVLKNTKTGEKKEMPIDGLFLAIGHIPNTDFLKGIVDLDEKGFVLTQKRPVTNVKGIFAGGDVQDNVYRQAISAAGSGCMAAMEPERYYETWVEENKEG